MWQYNFCSVLVASHNSADPLVLPTYCFLAVRITLFFAIFHSVVVPPSWPASLACGPLQESQQQQAESRSHPQVSPRQHFHANGEKHKRAQNKELALAPVNVKQKKYE